MSFNIYLTIIELRVFFSRIRLLGNTSYSDCPPCSLSVQERQGHCRVVEVVETFFFSRCHDIAFTCLLIVATPARCCLLTSYYCLFLRHICSHEYNDTVWLYMIMTCRKRMKASSPRSNYDKLILGYNIVSYQILLNFSWWLDTFYAWLWRYFFL